MPREIVHRNVLTLHARQARQDFYGGLQCLEVFDDDRVWHATTQITKVLPLHLRDLLEQPHSTWKPESLTLLHDLCPLLCITKEVLCNPHHVIGLVYQHDGEHREDLALSTDLVPSGLQRPHTNFCPGPAHRRELAQGARRHGSS